MSSSATIAPVEKELTVPLSPGEAFSLFTIGIARWWPLESHSVAGKEAVDVVFEAKAGGLIFERASNGAVHHWGNVLEVEADQRLLFTWYAGRDRSTEQQVEVTFTQSDQGCDVRLVHTGWEVLGERAAAVRAGYDTGWDLVLGECFGNEARAAG